jgi:hypothetical protein
VSRVLTNFVAYQVAWLACVLGGANGLPWVGVAVTAAAVAIHLVLVRSPGWEAVLILAVCAIGALWDGLLVWLGWLEYPSGLVLPWLAPVWIVALWAGLATTLHVSLRWLLGRWWLAALFGALGGPLAFYAGMRLGAVRFPDPALALAALAAGWSILMPLVCWIAVKLDGESPGRGGGGRSGNHA